MRAKYNLDPVILFGFLASAFMIARSSAWTQQVLSVTLLL
jgi:hypothetical protein